MKLKEKEIQNLEEQIPLVAEVSAKQAYLETLAFGRSVLVAENDEIVQIFPDGSRVFIQKIEPPIQIKKGTKFEIK